MDSKNLKSSVESLLFVSGEPVKIARLAKICSVEKKEIEAAINELNAEFQEKNGGLTVIRKGDMVQFATSAENSELVGQLVSGELGSEISKSGLEVLSIVAYRGPVTRAEIEAIRGVNCTYILRSLLIRGLVERKETADIRGYLYEISFDFLKKLGLANAQELPDWNELSKNEKLEEFLKNSDEDSGQTVPPKQETKESAKNNNQNQ